MKTNVVFLILVVLLCGSVIFIYTNFQQISALKQENEDLRNNIKSAQLQEGKVGEEAPVRSSVMHGIDVSHHNGKIDWKAVSKNKNIQFVYIKATEGKTYVDKHYKENIREARKYGMKVGSYHFFRMTSSAHEQFRHLSKVIDKDEQDLIPMIDVETTDRHPVSKVRDSLRVLLKLVEEHYGVKPMIYGTNRSYNEICGIWFNRYKLYLGRYGKNPPVIKGSEHYCIWQYSEKGRINGIPKAVDFCRFHPEYSIKDILLKSDGRQ